MAVSYVMDPSLGLFEPYSYDEYLKLPKEETETHLKTQEVYDKMQAETESQLALMKEEDRNSPLALKLKAYNEKLSGAISNLADSGLSSNSFHGLFDLKQDYNQNIKPIESAQANKVAQATEDAKKIETDHSTIFNYKASDASLEDYFKNPYIHNKSISLDGVTKEASTIASTIKQAYLHGDANIIGTNNPMWDMIKAEEGINPDDWNKAIASGDLSSGVINRALNNVQDQILRKLGVVKFDEATGKILRDPITGQPLISDDWVSNPEAVRQVKNAVQQGWASAIGTNKYNQVQSAAQIRKANATKKKGATGNTIIDTNADPQTGRFSMAPSAYQDSQKEYLENTLNDGLDFSINFDRDINEKNLSAVERAMGGHGLKMKYRHAVQIKFNMFNSKGQMVSLQSALNGAEKEAQKLYNSKNRQRLDAHLTVGEKKVITKEYNNYARFVGKFSKSKNKNQIAKDATTYFGSEFQADLPIIPAADPNLLANSVCIGGITPNKEGKIKLRMCNAGLGKDGIVQFNIGEQLTMDDVTGDSESGGKKLQNVRNTLAVPEGILVLFDNGTAGILQTKDLFQTDAIQAVKEVKVARRALANGDISEQNYNAQLKTINLKLANLFGKTNVKGTSKKKNEDEDNIEEAYE